MKRFRDFNEDLTCPVGMKYDKKLKICVPIKSTYGGRWWGVGRHHEKITNGNGKNGNGHTNGDANGGNGNGNGGNGNGGNGGGSGNGGT